MAYLQWWFLLLQYNYLSGINTYHWIEKARIKIERPKTEKQAESSILSCFMELKSQFQLNIKYLL